MGRIAAVVATAGLAVVVVVGPASAAPACQGSALGLKGLNQFLRAQDPPSTVGAVNSAFAHELGGLRFGPVARAITADCRG